MPPAGTSTLTYSLLLGATPGPRVNSAVGQFGEVTFDPTRDVTDTAPATATVTVLGSASLGLTADTATTAAGTSVVVNVLADERHRPACRCTSPLSARRARARSCSAPTEL